MREQTAHALPTTRREVGRRGGGGCGVGGPIRGVLDHQRSNGLFTSILSLVIDFGRSRCSGPPREVAEPSEGLKGRSLVIVVVRDLGGNGVVLAGCSKGVVIPLVEPVLVRRLCDHAGRALDGIRGGMKSSVIGRTIIEWSVEWVMKTTGQTDVVLLRPGRSEAGYAESEGATGESEPRWPKGRLWGLLLMVSIVLDTWNRVEGFGINGLTLEVGFIRGGQGVSDPRSREVEPRDLEDI